MAIAAPPQVESAPTVRARPLFDRAIVRTAIVDSVRKLDPRTLVRNPVIFVVESCRPSSRSDC